MCKYCRNDDIKLNKDILKSDIKLGGFKLVDLKVDIFDDKLCLDGEWDSELTTLKEIKINYCPMCGRKIQHAGDN